MLRPYAVAPGVMRIARIVFGGFAVMTVWISSSINMERYMPFDRNRHQRRSIRLAGYDYTQPVTYFITICTHERKPVLCAIQRGTVSPTNIGQVVACCWLALPRHFENVTLDSWVLMPDHLHGIIIISNNDALGAAVPTMPMPSNRPSGTHFGSLNAIVHNFKSISTRKANQIQCTAGAHLWQRNYYERIIRAERELYNTRQYIQTNASRP